MVTTHIPYIYNFVEERFLDEIQTFHFRMRDEAVNEIQLVSCPQDLYDREMVEGPGDTHYGLEIAQKHGLDSTIIDRAFRLRNCIQVTYSNPDPKPSRYNSKLSVVACENCNSKQNLHTHHILPQQACESQNVAESGFRKNGLYNLKVLCETCHENLHKNASYL
jgi:DNA mismatch repair ATPase MutS